MRLSSWWLHHLLEMLVSLVAIADTTHLLSRDGGRDKMATRRFRFGVVAAQAPSGEEWIEKARRIEELGYATLLMPDRLLGPVLSPVPALAVAAAATRSLRLGTFVLPAGWRNPVLLARECATLDFLSGGRFEPGLGAGLGDEDSRRAGFPYEAPGARVDRLAETLGVLKGILGGEGDKVNLRYPPPVQQPRPPILVAAGGKRSLALAAREADIVTLGVRPDRGEEVLAERIEWLHSEAKDQLLRLELNINLVAVVGDGSLPDRVRQRVQGLFGVDLDNLVRAGSPFVVSGSTEEMCKQIVGLRERLGISYITVPDDLMDAFAPVVERLRGS
jgi:probable F420-dependent oxidoreductase